jgi:hypothetical protein
MRLWVPNEFQAVGPWCDIRYGFKRWNYLNLDDKPVCTITTGVSDKGGAHTTRIEYYNMRHWSIRWGNNYDHFYIFEFNLRNPTIAQWTPAWFMEGLDNWNATHTDYSRIMHYSNSTGGNHPARFWVGDNVPVTNYFRVFRNRETYEERR